MSLASIVAEACESLELSITLQAVPKSKRKEVLSYLQSVTTPDAVERVRRWYCPDIPQRFPTPHPIGHQ